MGFVIMSAVFDLWILWWVVLRQIWLNMGPYSFAGECLIRDTAMTIVSSHIKCWGSLQNKFGPVSKPNWVMSCQILISMYWEQWCQAADLKGLKLVQDCITGQHLMSRIRGEHLMSDDSQKNLSIPNSNEKTSSQFYISFLQANGSFLIWQL